MRTGSVWRCVGQAVVLWDVSDSALTSFQLERGDLVVVLGSERNEVMKGWGFMKGWSFRVLTSQGAHLLPDFSVQQMQEVS